MNGFWIALEIRVFEKRDTIGDSVELVVMTIRTPGWMQLGGHEARADCRAFLAA